MVSPKFPDTNGMSDTKKLEVLIEYLVKLTDVLELRLEKLEKSIKELNGSE